MDFDDSPEEAAFRAEARAWLTAHATRKPQGATQGHRPPPAGTEGELAHVEACKEWQATLYDGGWAGITWPKEYGGRSGTPMQQLIFTQEESRFAVATGIFVVALGMVGPTLIAHGSEAQKERFLAPMLRGEEVWCQLFSEPSAGSDLAGLRTRAVSDGAGGWVVNGQKVWTSGAHFSDYGILLARTDPDQPKHRGITYFIVDMRSPGIEVRPLKQINGASHFNEVFLTDVYLPAERVVGEVNMGWSVAITTLANERTAIGGGGGVAFSDVLRLARNVERTGDTVIRQRLAQAYSRSEILRFLNLRLQTALSHGRIPGPESSVLKLAYSRHAAKTGDLSMALQGPAGALANGHAADDGYWQAHFLGQFGVRIGGGTDEVQANVIGERALGLPGEPRPDKVVPWRDLGVEHVR
jgi:alkylation response protein AidB-like acyl-CoA dehydrogenase